MRIEFIFIYDMTAEVIISHSWIAHLFLREEAIIFAAVPSSSDIFLYIDISA